jgi:AcrR family transcriptional regulator
VDSVLTATSIVASREGLAPTTIQKNSERASVSPGSVYQYFPDKQAILANSVTRELDQSRIATLDKIREWNHLPLSEFIERVIAFLAAYFQDQRDLSQHVFVRSSEVGRLEEHMTMRREVIRAVAAVFEQHRKDLRPTDAQRAATVAVHAVAGVLQAPLLDREIPFSINDLRNDVIEMIRPYLCTAP